MAKLKSMGLEGAKRAVRKLFGRQASPAGNSSPASGTSTGNDDRDGDGASGPRRCQSGDSNLSPDTNHNHDDRAPADASKRETSGPGDANSGQRGKAQIGGNPSLETTDLKEPTISKDNGNDSATDEVMDATRFPEYLQRSQQHSKMDQKDVYQENQCRSPSDPGSDKENQPPDGAHGNMLVSPMKKLNLVRTDDDLSKAAQLEEETGIETPKEELTEEEKAFRAEREKHLVFIEEALDMARLALKTNETPVGCVLVHNDKIIARGMNATNVTRNGTRHAEFMAICALLSHPPKNGPRTTSLKPKIERTPEDEADDDASIVSPQPDEGNEDGSKGHLYPYGQKEHPDERVDKSIIRECTLYVTVEPCVMCASLLRQLGIKKVFFGAVNDKFGGTGGVFSIHANSLPVRDDGQTASAHPQPPPMRLPDGKQVLGTSFPPSGGDGGNVEPGYEIEGGWGRDEAVGLLRRFYVQENGRAPVPRKKEGRAARLAALEKDDGVSVNSGSASGGTLSDGDELGPSAEGTEKNDLEGEDGVVKREVDGAESKEATIAG